MFAQEDLYAAGEEPAVVRLILDIKLLVQPQSLSGTISHGLPGVETSPRKMAHTESSGDDSRDVEKP